jgi:isopentenyl-diphosphate delta-isomerase
MEEVVLVNEQDQQVGTKEKLAAHKEGLLHRAFSIFIFNDKHEMLLQQRAFTKYHSGGLWTNACCSHPRVGESPLAAAQRRLKEEMGFVTNLEPFFSFIYRADVGGDLIEHEYDHVFLGTYSGPIDKLNPEEVAAYRWISLEELVSEIAISPEHFTEWFKIAQPLVMQKIL